MDKGRMEAFSDGVLAVAITLLVLDLHASADAGHLATQIGHEWPSFAAYAVSFATIGVIWVNHHALLALMSRVDRRMLYYNLFLLLWVTAIPFTTATLAEFLRSSGWDGRIAVLLFGLTMFGMSVGFTGMLAHSLRAGLTIRPVSPADRRRSLQRFGFGLLAYPVITLVGLLSPVVMLVLSALLTGWYILEQTPILPAEPTGGSAAELQ